MAGQARFEIGTSTEGDALVLSASGEFDSAAKPTFLAAAIPAVVAGMTVVADLEFVTFMDSSGLRVLVTCYQAAQDSGGQFLVRNQSGPVAYILEATGLTELFG